MIMVILLVAGLEVLTLPWLSTPFWLVFQVDILLGISLGILLSFRSGKPGQVNR